MVAANPLFLRDAELDRALELLFLAERELQARSGGVLARHALSTSDYRILYVLRRRPGTTPASLARLLGVSRQAVSRPIQRLVDVGHIRRDPNSADRRKLTLRLSESAERQVDEASASQRRHMRAAFKKAGAEAVEGFGRVLGELLGDGRSAAALKSCDLS